MPASLVAKIEGLLLVVVHGLLIAAASLAEGFPDSSASKEPACNSGDPVPSLGCEEPLEKGMVTQSSILSGEFHG